jgi:pimeloyl-ACP methyl ester carboxylesterase
MKNSDTRIATGSLEVAGASVYFEVAGAGPVLLLIPGGASDAGDFARIIGPLADRYTVVTFDPRGISRSRLTKPAQDLSLDVLADDAHRLLMEVSAAPAYVLGSSGGGVIGLALAERHPESVRALVAHEPPLVNLLPPGTASRTSSQVIFDTYRKVGIGPAIQQFIALTGLGAQGPENGLSPELQEAMAQRMARMQQNVEFFLAHYLLPVTTYVPDVAALCASSSRVVVGIGETSSGQLAHDTALALADRLESTAVTFPGDHSGFFFFPDLFAQKLDEVLRAE